MPVSVTTVVGLPLVGLVMPGGREREDDERRGEHADGRDHEQQHAKGAGDLVHELAHLVVRALVLVLADDRDEGLAERTFGEQAAQEVRNLERHEPGVHERARAENDRVEDFAEQAGDA